MKKFIYILAAAAIALVACGKDDETKKEEGGSGDNTPKPEAKAFSVSPLSISVEADATTASITVTSEVDWKASSDNAAVALSPSSGKGNGTIVLSFNANTSEQEVKANITVSTEDKDAESKSYTVPFTQAGIEVIPAVKPAPGTVLAEWYFTTTESENLRKGDFEQNAKDKTGPAYAMGNSGDAYVPSNVSGNGKLEYYNGVNKADTQVTLENKTCVKRCIGNRGEPCIYGTWVGDYFIWSATLANKAPIAAGTKIHLFFALRPNNENVMKYWKCEYLDGTEWKETKTYELKYDASGAGTVESPKQINELINETITLTADTPSVQFRFTCTQNANCSEGKAIGPLDANYVLRFAGEWPEAGDDYQNSLKVTKHPIIEVVE